MCLFKINIYVFFWKKKDKSTTIMAPQTERMLTFATEGLKCKKTAFQKNIDIKLPFYFSGTGTIGIIPEK